MVGERGAAISRLPCAPKTVLSLLPPCYYLRLRNQQILPMIRFDKIVENWARAYKPMLHNPANGNRRFFRTNSVQTVDELLRSIGTLKSPLVAIEVYLEGSIENKSTTAEWTVWFFCKGEATNIDISTDAKIEAHTHLLRFIATLRQWKRNQYISQRINLGDGQGSLRYFTQGPILDDWYAVGTTIEVPEGIDNCAGDLYLDESLLLRM